MGVASTPLVRAPSLDVRWLYEGFLHMYVLQVPRLCGHMVLWDKRVQMFQ